MDVNGLENIALLVSFYDESKPTSDTRNAAINTRIHELITAKTSFKTLLEVIDGLPDETSANQRARGFYGYGNRRPRKPRQDLS
jgi:hypothetical protein